MDSRFFLELGLTKTNSLIKLSFNINVIVDLDSGSVEYETMDFNVPKMLVHAAYLSFGPGFRSTSPDLNRSMLVMSEQSFPLIASASPVVVPDRRTG